MKKDSVIPLIEKWELFLEIKKNNDLYEFAQWILDEREQGNQKTNKRIEIFVHNEEYLAANYINRLNKYVKSYVKPLFKDTMLNNSEDFALLSLISRMDRPTKREVCIANIMELSTGIDMIRRLIKLNYIKEEPHEVDGRSMRLTITEKGIKVLTIIYERLALLEQKVLADLTRNDKQELLRILEYLDTYHKKNILKFRFNND